MILVTPAEGSPRLDAMLRARLPGVSRRDIHFAIATGLVTVNGRPGAKGQRLRPGDRIDVGRLEPALGVPPAPGELEIAVLHVDDTVMALDKPAGIAATARRFRGQPSAAGYLLARFPELAGVGPSPLEAGLAHRLDTETSGVLLVARTPSAWTNLRRQFRGRGVRKEYLALVHGRLEQVQRLEDDLAHRPGSPARMGVVKPAPTRSGSPRRAWHALCSVDPIARARDTTLVRVDLETGVTHQVRVQLAAIGHAIVGDALYGEATLAASERSRLLLHAATLTLRHPGTGAALSVRSPLPADFRGLLSSYGYETKPPQEDPAGAFGLDG
jgi:23S rRNA pseudouridine1911/1915/1917 synthase